tara:strand:- start:1046 stop:1243 length:198 start_codon:yes stop_codon:yes gene_type:complete
MITKKKYKKAKKVVKKYNKQLNLHIVSYPRWEILEMMQQYMEYVVKNGYISPDYWDKNHKDLIGS